MQTLKEVQSSLNNNARMIADIDREIFLGLVERKGCREPSGWLEVRYNLRETYEVGVRIPLSPLTFQVGNLLGFGS